MGSKLLGIAGAACVVMLAALLLVMCGAMGWSVLSDTIQKHNDRMAFRAMIVGDCKAAARYAAKGTPWRYDDYEDRCLDPKDT